MSIVVGVAPGHISSAAIAAAVLLARTEERRLVVAAVNAAAWPPSHSIGYPDHEFQAFVAGETQAALDAARAAIPAELTVEYVVHRASSARRGLLEVCERHGATQLVVGAKGESRDGETELGSVVTGLLQSASVPVVIVPNGYDAAGASRLTRVTAAYSGSETSGELVLGAAALAAEAGCAMRIASFHTRPRGLAESGVGFDTENDVIAAWENVIREHTRELHDDIERFATPPTAVEVVVGAGRDWHAALRAVPWDAGEVLVVGSSSLGLLARISLGSHAVKIVRHSPVPVVMVPRRATGGYAARAGGKQG
ncbi:universal stress protein [Leucobacter sp. gxy201]|uniref:universal stress protein n=1 Tax=Leucobacter sp. gxy201 TaxID=2957200 RepID=UPI003DA002C5